MFVVIVVVAVNPIPNGGSDSVATAGGGEYLIPPLGNPGRGHYGPHIAKDNLLL